MIYLTLSILSSTLIFICFRLFSKYRVDNMQAIIVNYLVATLLGYLVAGEFNIDSITTSTWKWNAVGTGIAFVGMFYLMALSSQKIGVAVTSISNKMSVAIPIGVAFLLYGDTFSWLKLAGVVLVMVGVLMVSKTRESTHIDKKYLILPLVLFFGNGLIDSFIKFTEEYFVDPDETALFVPTLFGFAFLSGMIWMVAKKRWQFTARSIIGGICLGIPNYGSIYFLMRTLEIEGFESSVIFPVNNMGVVIVATLAAFIMFSERLSRLNWIGLLLSIIAIGMILFSQHG